MSNSNRDIEWTQEKREVWSTVKNYTGQILKGEANGFLKYFHKDYSGWNYSGEKRVNKSDIKRELKNLPNIDILSYSIHPASIQIKNNVAIVHYSYSAKYKDALGEVKSKNGNYTDILVKEEDSWLIIGDYIRDKVNFNNTEKINIR